MLEDFSQIIVTDDDKNDDDAGISFLRTLHSAATQCLNSSTLNCIRAVLTTRKKKQRPYGGRTGQKDGKKQTLLG